MTSKTISPVAAFNIDEGVVTPLTEPWPDIDTASGYRWLHVDLNDPGIALWAKEHLPAIAERALQQTETRPRCEKLADGLILNLRAVNLNPNSSPEDMVSLRVWATRNAVVSARRRKVWAVDDIRQSAEAGKAPETVGRFLTELVHGVMIRIEKVSLALDEETDDMEEAVSDGVRLPHGQLTQLRSAVIKMRRFVNPQREAIATLAAMEDWILAPEDLALLRETSNRTRRIVEELDATRDRLFALQDHIDAERSHALSRNSYILSVVAAIFLPLGFLTGLFGVNIGGMPGIGSPMAFWVLSGASVICGIALFLIFKFAKWL
ncbi:zinc transporter ZntB [Flavimaricola marinus]|uniref:Zinc transport protein ZntB n=1 Tax=Flavimaricola marinus TaxID=1819565 RepID=A0A238LJ25_9RHOB|nr:zinc transporter ZntB [Flavimaricola marinus]SMY09414.1 Zinc transport protein ZntB [Flavimaricola marinus]